MRRVGEFTPQESMVYTYWIIIVQLLQIGITWEAIMQFTENEIMLVLGVHQAFGQIKADAKTKSSARSGMM